jgi:dsDNA-binding SOS-regulon protein
MELVEYKEKNGHCNFPTKNGSLGKWISTQRTYFTSKKLKADRYEKLVGIGFAFEDANFANSRTKSEHEKWNKRFLELNEKWNIRFMELETYKEKNGHCDCPGRNGSFGKWVTKQRTLFRSKKLKADRYDKIVGIRFA